MIELLVVITIIAILASMLLPALHKAKVQALRLVCMNNQGQIVKAVHFYGDDNGSYLPHGSQFKGLNDPQNDILRAFYWGDAGNDFGQIYQQDYLAQPDTFFCPDGMVPNPDNTIDVPAGETFFEHTDATYGLRMFTGYAVFINVLENPPGGAPSYEDIPRRLVDDGDWVVLTDDNSWNMTDVNFQQQAHERWRNHPSVDGAGPSEVPFNGINVGLLDGSVHWRPAADTQQRYSRYGGNPAYRIVF